jgi:uncharacterized protein YrrD
MRDIASLVGLKVVSSREGREVGVVSQCIANLATGVLEGLIVGKGPSEKGVEAKDIEALGQDAIMVPDSSVARHLSEVPALLEKRRDPSAGPREVLTDAGKRLGVLGSVFIDPASLKVAHYEASGGALRDMMDGPWELHPMPGTVDGRDSVIVPAAAFQEAAEHPGGLRAGLAKLGETARVQAKQAAKGLDKGAEKLKRGAAVVGEKAGEAAAKAKTAGGAAAAKVAEVSKHAAEEVKEATGAAAAKVAEVGKHAVEEVKEVGEAAVDKVRHLGHEDEEEIPTEEAAKAGEETGDDNSPSEGDDNSAGGDCAAPVAEDDECASRPAPAARPEDAEGCPDKPAGSCCS